MAAKKKKVKAVKVPKPVKAWMLVSNNPSPSYYAYWTFDNKRDIEQPRAATRFNPETDKWIRVLIVPADGSYTITPRAGKGGRKR